MAGTVYLRTNRFEVKLEGIAFKAKDFESLCKMDFLFPEGKVWVRPPVVGLDVMRHPRDPSIILVFLNFGVGCIILRLPFGEKLPQPIVDFLTDKRIRFVGFGIPEKKDLFPFEELGLTKSKVDVGYLAAKFLKDPKFKSCELGELARKVLGIKKMVGLTDASSFERHEQIKCGICQLFVSSLIAMALLGPENKKRIPDSPKKSSFLKNLNSLPLLNEGWFKLPKGKKDNNKISQVVESGCNIRVNANDKEAIPGDDSVNANGKGDLLGDDFVHAKGKEGCLDDEKVHVKAKEGGSGDDSVKMDVFYLTKSPLKGILKCPSSGLEGCNLSPPKTFPPPCTSMEQKIPPGGPNLKRANSKGCNVSFK